MRLHLLLISFILFTGQGFAAGQKPAAKAPLLIHLDTDSVQVRPFNEATLNNYAKSPEFQYSGVYSGPSPWRLFWNWIWGIIDSFLSKGNRGAVLSTILKYLAILLGVGALVFLILRMAGVDAMNIFKRKPESANVPYTESLENIHEINFDADIEKAITQQNYRYAVRLLYLRSLKQLSDSGRISWEINKTNSAYVSELTNDDQRVAFNLITRQFEYIWYGSFDIDANAFQKVNAQFHDFKGIAA